MSDLMLVKLVIDCVAATAVLVAVILFLADRKSYRAFQQASDKNSLADRERERATLLKLSENGLAHVAEAMRLQADANRQIASGLADIGKALRACPYNKSPKPKEPSP